MPKVAGYKYRERLDLTLFDTHVMVPGQELSFFASENSLGDPHRTNMEQARVLVADKTFFVMSIGLRILGTTRDEEDALLDFFVVEAVIGETEYGGRPGSVCSTMRYVDEDDEHDPLQSDQRLVFLPGYVLQRPLVIPVRMNFLLRVLASKDLPTTRPRVRGIMFGLLSRDIP